MKSIFTMTVKERANCPMFSATDWEVIPYVSKKRKGNGILKFLTWFPGTIVASGDQDFPRNIPCHCLRLNIQ